jgi:eukaryotic-like serine/threonine-protein kinase
MTPERWQRIQELFGEAIDLPADEREAYLDRACASDAELRARIGRMLVLDEADSPLLDSPPADLVEAVITQTPGTRVGARVGAYRIVSELGRGGMGTVYVAVREDVGMRVALKLVRGDLAAPEHRERLLLERRVLARLDHPNIARLLDVGVTEEGTPYFAMELVEGELLDSYCDSRRLTVVERLALFTQVCAAVQYAHQNLVIHRDLKPSNIMVDRSGSVKLLDFGIAKLLDESDPGTVALTGTGMRMLTPQYAAPEQVRGEAVTTATDVYALGVVLYELLTGRRPYASTAVSRSEIERQVLETVPARPSSLALRTGEVPRSEAEQPPATAEEISAARGTTPAGLRRALRGDLDTLILKALEKEPRRRFASVQQLLEEIERFRRGEPLTVRPATFTYTARKFVRRHRAGVATTVLILLLLASVGIAVGLERRAELRARMAMQEAEQAADFLGQLFGTTDPRRAQGSLISTPALLEWGERQIGVLDRQPQAQAQVLSRIAEAYIGLGLYQRAAPQFERALELRYALHGGDHPDLAESLWWLGVLRTDQGEFEHATQLLQESLAMRRRIFGSDHPHVVEGIAGMGFVLVARGELTEAEAVFREAMATGSRAGAMPRLSIPDPANGVVLSLVEQGRFAEAAAHGRVALSNVRSVHGEAHPFHMIALANLGRALHGAGELAEADLLLREAVENTHRIQGEAHPRLAVYLGWYASLLQQKGQVREAESLARQALDIQRRAHPAGHYMTAQTLTTLGQILVDSDRAAEAEPLLREAVSVGERGLPPSHWQLARARTELGIALASLQRAEEAESLLVAAAAGLQESLGGSHPLTRRARAFLLSVPAER